MWADHTGTRATISAGEGLMGAARVGALFRYPVKSMLGEEIDTTVVGERGLLGDRAYALIDQETGKVASAKNPLRWGVLFACHAEFVCEPRAGSDLPPVQISTPAGDKIRSDEPNVHESLSRIVGREVRLETRPPDEPVLEEFRPRVEGFPDAKDETVTDERIALVAPGTFFDAAPVHIVTTATLARLGELAPETIFSAQRFRPNVVVALDGAHGFVENDWVDRSLTFGPDVRASVFLSAPRCIMTTLEQSSLPRDPGVLRALARHNRLDIPGVGPRSCAGVYALVTAGGTVRDDDPVEIA